MSEKEVDDFGRGRGREGGGKSEIKTPTQKKGGGRHQNSHLLRQLRHRQRPVRLRPPRRQRREAHHEKVQARERDQVDRELAQVRVELPREAQAAGHARHDGRDQVVEVAERGRRQLERAEADVVERLVVEDHALVRVLDQLVDRERGVVRLDDGVRDLGRGDDREGHHHAVRVLLADLADQQRSHAGARAAAQRVRDLEALEAVAGLGLLADDVEDRVDELGALGVVALGPVVSGAFLLMGGVFVRRVFR